MALTLQEYGIPLDICLMIEKINYKERFKLIFEELINKINNNEIYKSHEWYFIQILSFIQGNYYKTPKFNDKITYNMFNNYIDDINNVDLTNYYHYLLYSDTMNIQLYQNKVYETYYIHN